MASKAKTGYLYFETRIDGNLFNYKVGDNGVLSITEENYGDDIVVTMTHDQLGKLESRFQITLLPYYVLGKS